MELHEAGESLWSVVHGAFQLGFIPTFGRLRARLVALWGPIGGLGRFLEGRESFRDGCGWEVEAVWVYSSDQHARLIYWRNRVDSHSAIVKLPSLMLVRHFKNFVRAAIYWSNSHLGPELFAAESRYVGPGGVAPKPNPAGRYEASGAHGACENRSCSIQSYKHAILPTIAHDISYERAYNFEIGSGPYACQVRESNV